MKVLVTGAAGFIGFHVAKGLLERGDEVVGIDNLNDYYSVALKKARVNELISHRNSTNFKFEKIDLADRRAIEDLFLKEKFDKVINLAAQAGVRYSIENPHAYIDSNIVGFTNILEACRHNAVKHLVYASSSSVYGSNESMPFSINDNVDHPLSLYAATKKANELMAHSYSSLYNLPTTGLRFFSVYGPWGRPDMAFFIFTEAILKGEAIDVFNNGNHLRDFTYVDDVVEGVLKVLDDVATANKDWNGVKPDPGSSNCPWRIYNIGNQSPVKLMDCIESLEDALGKKAKKNFLPLQPGDVPDSFADAEALKEAVAYKPDTDIKYGLKNFVDWYLTTYRNLK